MVLVSSGLFDLRTPQRGVSVGGVGCVDGVGVKEAAKIPGSAGLQWWATGLIALLALRWAEGASW